MLTQLKVPYIAERFLGVTIPDNGVMYACSYSGLHKLSLGADDLVLVETDESRSEDYELLKSKGETLGIFGGAPIREDSKTKISYLFDARADSQRIEVLHRGRTEALSFVTLSGDWLFASLLKCGRHILLAEPYAIEVHRIA